MPTVAASDPLTRVLATQRRGVLATIRHDGRPQMSTISFDYDPQAALIRVSVTDDRAKTRNVRRDPRASLHVQGASPWVWTVVDGSVELTPVAAAPDDATVDELVALYRAVGGEHPNWSEFRSAMVADHRLVLRLSVDHVYGDAPQD